MSGSSRLHSRPRRAAIGALAIAALVAAIAAPSSAIAVEPSRLPQADPAQAPEATGSDELIVRFRPGTTAAARSRIARDRGMTVVRTIPGTDIAVLRAAAGSRAAARAALDEATEVLESQPNHQRFLAADPRDEEFFDAQWGMENTGQEVGDVLAKSNVDIDLPQAHAVTTGAAEIVVAVIDSGVDFSQPDLADRAWINEGEIGPDGMGGDKSTNGEDDDGNGYDDDWQGWDFCNDDNTVFDSNVANEGVRGHGTHVAGIVAASLDGEGVVGVAPNVRIMALKFIDGTSGCGWDHQAIAAVEYAKANGVRIINASWGGEQNGSALRSSIQGSGALFVAASGNGNRFSGIGFDLGEHAFLPAGWPDANILSVAAIDPRGRLTSFSNYGTPEVDVAAPGYWVASTYPETEFDDGLCETPCYAYSNGTSMAAPHVSGVAALAATVRPELLDDPVALKARLLGATKPLSATAGKTVTGGMIDALYAVDTVAPASAGPTSQGFVSGERIGSSAGTRLRWGAGSDDLSGVGSYVVHRSVNGGGWSTIASKATTTSVDTKVALGSTVRYRVRARDRGGNVGGFVEGPTIRAQVSQQGTSAARYSSGWKKAKSSSASGGSTTYATKAGASVTYRFTGRAIAIVAPKASSRGSFRVYIDGTLAGTVSTYAKKTQTRVVVFARSWTTSQPRTIKLVVAGTKGHPRVDVDAFLVLR